MLLLSILKPTVYGLNLCRKLRVHITTDFSSPSSLIRVEDAVIHYLNRKSAGSDAPGST